MVRSRFGISTFNRCTLSKATLRSPSAALSRFLASASARLNDVLRLTDLTFFRFI
jgi:hypothetical protein